MVLVAKQQLDRELDLNLVWRELAKSRAGPSVSFTQFASSNCEPAKLPCESRAPTGQLKWREKEFSNSRQESVPCRVAYLTLFVCFACLRGARPPQGGGDSAVEFRATANLGPLLILAPQEPKDADVGVRVRNGEDSAAAGRHRQ